MTARNAPPTRKNKSRQKFQLAFDLIIYSLSGAPQGGSNGTEKGAMIIPSGYNFCY